MAVKKSDKNRNVKKRDIEEHIVDKTTVDKGVVDDAKWEVTQGEVHSDTKLEDDQGIGPAAVLRAFDFSVNPEAFHKETPSKQALFDAHAKQIEYFLYKDGLEVMYEIKPQLHLSKNRKFYRIIVAATPRQGFLLHETPQKLTDIVNAKTETTDKN